MGVLAEASQVAAQQEKSVTEYLLDKKLFEENDLLGVLADRLGVAPIDLDKVVPPSDIKETVPVELAREVGCLPIAKYGGLLTVAVSNPFDVVKHDDLRLATGCELRLALALEPQIKRAQDALYSTRDEDMKNVLDQVDPDLEVTEKTEEEDVVDVAAVSADSEDAPVVKLVNLLIYNAIKAKASDIHI